MKTTTNKATGRQEAFLRANGHWQDGMSQWEATVLISRIKAGKVSPKGPDKKATIAGWPIGRTTAPLRRSPILHDGEAPSRRRLTDYEADHFAEIYPDYQPNYEDYD